MIVIFTYYSSLSTDKRADEFCGIVVPARISIFKIPFSITRTYGLPVKNIFYNFQMLEFSYPIVLTKYMMFLKDSRIFNVWV